jgi:hypothetical protein
MNPKTTTTSASSDMSLHSYINQRFSKLFGTNYANNYI